MSKQLVENKSKLLLLDAVWIKNRWLNKTFAPTYTITHMKRLVLKVYSYFKKLDDTSVCV